MSERRLPYSRTFLEGVPLRFLNLPELSRGALDSRALADDGYWQICDEKPIALLLLRAGRPYRIVGHETPDLASFIRFLNRDKRELTITFRFVERGTLPCILKVWSEEPMLQELQCSEGDVMDLLRSLKRAGESGLLELEYGETTSLVPVDNGKISRGYLPGSTIRGRDLLTYLSKEVPDEATACFYPGEVPSLAPVGLSEIGLLMSSFNNWLEALRPTWPECDDITEELFRSLARKNDFLGAFEFYPDDGLFLKKPLDRPERLPGVFVELIKGVAERHASEETCIRVFGSANRENRVALATAGLKEIVGSGA